MRSILLLVAALTLDSFVVESSNTPVFLWTSNRAVHFPEVYAGHTVTDQEFSDDFLRNILPSTTNQHNAVKNDIHVLAVFLEEKMSLKDLTRRAQVFNTTVKGSVFAHLRSIMKSTDSKFLPSVSSAYDTLNSMIRGNFDDDFEKGTPSGYNIVEISNPTEDFIGAGKNDAIPGSAIIYIIHIPDIASPRDIDEWIGNVDRELRSLGLPYSAIYTGKSSDMERIQPAVVAMDDGTDYDVAEHAGSRRKLQQQLPIYYPVNYMFVNITNCLYMYAQNVTISILGHGTWTLPLDPTVDDSSFCGNYSAELSLSYYGIDNNLTEVNFLMIFGVTQGLNAGYWLMTNFTVTYSILNDTDWYNATTEMYPYFITETPYGFSYSCYELPPISPLHSMDGLGVKTVNVTFSALQLQAFNITNYQFGYYNDCVGFFTITTWAVLVVLFIMVGILMFAACMFAGLQTPDRYEDAHGKQLTINAME